MTAASRRSASRRRWLLGRDIRFAERVARDTGLQVVACTGIYTYDHLPLFWQSRSADVMSDAFVHDIEQGIQGTDIKATFLKCVADEPGVTENVEKVHRACARASLRTGRPIMAHSRPASETGPHQIEILLEEGVAPEQIQIAHTGDTDDLDHIERLLETGVWIGLDRYGIEMYLPTERRNATTLALLERGYADRMVLSADSCASLDWFPGETVGQLVAAGAVGLDDHPDPRPGDSRTARGRDHRRAAVDDAEGQPEAMAGGLGRARIWPASRGCGVTAARNPSKVQARVRFSSPACLRSATPE